MPECGSELAGRGTVVRGTPYVRRGFVLLGVVTLLAGLVIGGLDAAARTNKVDWYQYRPTSWVLGDLNLPDKAARLRAWNEIDRRILNNALSLEQIASFADLCLSMIDHPETTPDNRAWNELMRQNAAGILSADRRSRLVDRCLQEQGSATPFPDWRKWVDFLSDEFLANRLSPAQREAFLGNMLKMNFVARARVVRGDEVPYRLAMDGRGSEQRFWYRQKLGTLSLDGKVVSQNGGSSSGSGFGGSSVGSWLALPKTINAGRHELQLHSTLELHAGSMSGNYEASKPIATRELNFTAPFELFDTAPSDLMQLIDDPTLQNAIDNNTKIDDARAPGYDGKGLSATVNFRDLPIECAFDVFVLIDGREMRVGTATAFANRSSGTSISGGDFPATNLPPTLSFILRSSEQTARRTVDMSRIWKGSIRIDDVPVKLRPAKG